MKNFLSKRLAYKQKKERMLKKGRYESSFIFNIQNTPGNSIPIESVSARVEDIVKHEFSKIEYANK
ncbi:hypothetical protein QX233_19010 [Chryseobacterium gambrini]|uniref:Uncharacterized protein n=1 Tax=Chryseobacterium gambrini TaxID=373672 RepID=A0AAJ1VLD6_9FLAO|nr:MULTISPECIES: hypothetical protein [Chryseobacterium]MDN4014568.1 hypothetical protein [Chryseobacterium gambrini]MDN4028113.1 hypothetical protein [Chryseobacterium gambrini]QWA39827.1 hypothetical protein KKI44_06360 [Chryseobacterium sp. ZHDP1]